MVLSLEDAVVWECVGAGFVDVSSWTVEEMAALAYVFGVGFGNCEHPR